MTTAPTPDSEILLHAAEDGATRVDVRLEGETVWLTQAQLVELFQSSKQNISEHIQNIFEEGELDTEATVRKFRTVRSEGSRDAARQLTHYNLDVIISVGYRVKSATATKFRIWATDRSRDEHACQRRNLIQRPAMRCLQTKKDAARVGDAFCVKVETPGIEPGSDLDFRGLLRV